MVLPELTASSVGGVLEQIAGELERSVPGVSAAAARRGLGEREALGSTAIGHGFAIPHCRLEGVRAVELRVAAHPAGVDFGASDGAPVKLFFVLVSPASGAAAHLQALGAIARFLRSPEHRARLLAARSEAELVASLEDEPAACSRSEVTADV
jgi:PTS system nitrogen regulatory IIA component